MSQKYKAFVAAQLRDAEPCVCGHPRGQHVGDKHCIMRTINQCDCQKFVPKEATR